MFAKIQKSQNPKIQKSIFFINSQSLKSFFLIRNRKIQKILCCFGGINWIFGKFFFMYENSGFTYNPKHIFAFLIDKIHTLGYITYMSKRIKCNCKQLIKPQ